MNGIPTRPYRNGLPRRDFIKALGVVGGGLALGGMTGCGGDGGSPSGGSSPGGIQIPDTGAKLPTGEVKFRWLGTPDAMTGFIDEFSAKYNEAHPNITIEYDGFPAPEIRELLPLGISSGTAHDLFNPAGLRGADLVARGWVAPLDDYIPNFEEWKAAFPPNTLLEGVQIFDGKTYSFPLQDHRWYLTTTLYNRAVVERADVDLSEEVPTWSEFREIARKITEQGNGQTYGIVIPSVRLAEYVRALARTAGSPTQEWINPLTGEYDLASDGFVEAVEFLLALQDDGSVFPGSLSLTAQEATPRVVSGNAAIILDGPWVPADWEQTAPDFEFGVAGQPVPEVSDPLPHAAEATGNIGYWLYAESKVKEVAGDIFAYLGSVEGQTAFGLARGVGGMPIQPKARDALYEASTSESKKVMDLAETIIINPAPLIRNPDVAMVYAELKPPTPGPPQVLESIMIGEADPRSALQQLSDGFNNALDDAIAAAVAKGANVSRDDWVFPNFDPHRSYEEQDYAEL